MSTVVAKNLTVQNSPGTASTNVSFDGTKLVSTALDNSIVATATAYDLGVGQTWQNVTASRAFGVAYTNTTGKPIMVLCVINTTITNNAAVAAIIINGVPVATFSIYSYSDMTSFIVPPGMTYAIINGGNAQVNSWSELR